MSATNRGAIRTNADAYYTPIEVINNFLDKYPLQKGNILEPSAGGGGIL